MLARDGIVLRCALQLLLVGGIFLALSIAQCIVNGVGNDGHKCVATG